MYKVIITLICLLITLPTVATQVQPKELDELVRTSDVIVEVDIADVYGKDKFGAIVRSPKMSTGPGLDNKIVLYVCSKQVLLNVKGFDMPKCFETSIWEKWHLSLESFLDFQSQSVILLLEGNKLQRVHPGHFIRPLNEKTKILQLIKKRDTVK